MPHDNSTPEGALSQSRAALLAGLGLLVMTACAPFAYFHFLPQGYVAGDGAATLEQLRSNATPFLIGAFLLFVTYVMDILVAWALYWFFRPGHAALSQLTAWMRLLYTALAFLGLMAYFKAYYLATNFPIGGGLSETSLQAEVLFEFSAAKALTSVALLFFGVHLLTLALTIFSTRYVPKLIGLAVMLAGLSYIGMEGLKYIDEALAPSWLMILALGELLFMLWLFFAAYQFRKRG